MFSELTFDLPNTWEKVTICHKNICKVLELLNRPLQDKKSLRTQLLDKLVVCAATSYCF